MFFAFEADFVDSLRCIPMQVRYKLDTCGVKLKLQHWHQLSHQDRQDLVDLPCETSIEITTYRNTLQEMIIKQTGSPAKELDIDPDPDWLNSDQIPSGVIHKAAEYGIDPTIEAWKALTPLQRFALIKLSRSGHENRNFLPAWQEFTLKIKV